ncbi:type VI secretion system baseplate subunit TssE [Paraburkholderia sp. MMS20-SJTR3]|uniref:Type VI secretion system baseplate subunit TssE n=1 Tax=Paraburkholderia sejongensis TaxID=2886946 RepID=A0ABS8K0K8_9BURK|nr:type VI secretion system baseplate subunit TssE [Paraburkholderia sp. MMS20-SJTR3]MCC8395697.1 type VI secretion system baseplate subunit TssE [Paraburkholderia sp. MMS20-SJTR3]
MSASDIRHRQAYLPSLIDRLLDDAPQRRTEHPNAYAPDAERMHRIIQRDLSLLFNTTSLDDEFDTTRYRAVADSVVNYGIAALCGSYLTNRNWETVEASVRAAIVRFEPRLIADALRIRPVHSENPIRYNQLAIEISGLMHWSPYPLEFRVQSAFDIETNHVTFAQDSHREH